MSEELGFKPFLHFSGTESQAILSAAVRVSFLIGQIRILISAPGERLSELTCDRCRTLCLAHVRDSVLTFLVFFLLHFVCVSNIKPAGLSGGGLYSLQGLHDVSQSPPPPPSGGDGGQGPLVADEASGSQVVARYGQPGGQAFPRSSF